MFVRGQTDKAISLQMPLTDFSTLPQMNDHELLQVKTQMREKYATHYTAVEQPESLPPDPDHVDTDPTN